MDDAAGRPGGEQQNGGLVLRRALPRLRRAEVACLRDDERQRARIEPPSCWAYQRMAASTATPRIAT
jgi:hypothetical protein